MLSFVLGDRDGVVDKRQDGCEEKVDEKGVEKSG